MKASLSVTKLNRNTFEFSSPIIFKDKTFTKTYSQNYEFIFLTENAVDTIQTEVNLLPLFWENQTYSFNKNWDLNLENLNLQSIGFGLISNIESMPLNYLFALEFALFKFLLKKNLIPIPSFYSSTLTTHSSSLLPVHEFNFENLPYNSFIKIKIGLTKNSEESDNNLIKLLIKNNNIIRLDSNRTLSAHSLEKILTDVDPKFIDMIEEPFENPLDWQKFKFRDDFKLALDETLTAQNFGEIYEQLKNHVKYFVLKPTFNTSISGVFKFLENKTECIPIISSSYEFKDSFNFLIFLANYCDQIFTPLDLVHGLGTYKQMKQTSFFSIKSPEYGQKLQAFGLF